MCDLICDVITCCVLSSDAGKMNASDKIKEIRCRSCIVHRQLAPDPRGSCTGSQLSI